MIDLKDPRTLARVAVVADVSLITLKRYLEGGETICRPSSVRRIREALAAFESEKPARKRVNQHPLVRALDALGGGKKPKASKAAVRA